MTSLTMITTDLFLVQHVVNRVEQRPQKRIDFRKHVAGEEAEFLPGFHGRTDQNNLPNMFRAQCFEGQSDREI